MISWVDTGRSDQAKQKVLENKKIMRGNGDEQEI
jgi:hypothetical protein